MFSPNRRIFKKNEFIFHEDRCIIWKYGGFYKILRCLTKNRLYTKVRLKSVLPNVIHEDEKGYIEGRHINEAIYSVHN